MSNWLGPFWLKYLGMGWLLVTLLLFLFGNDSLNNAALLPLLMIGLYCLIFSKESDENDRVKQIRYEALMAAFGLFFTGVMVFGLVQFFMIGALLNKPTAVVGLTAFCLPAFVAGVLYLGCFHGKIWFGRDQARFSEEEG